MRVCDNGHVVWSNTKATRCVECGMTASKEAKQMGVKSLTEVADFYGWTTAALRKWHKQKPERFKAVILGYIEFNRG